MTSVYKRKDSKKWYITWTDHTGKRITQCSGTTDKAAAIRIANKFEAEAQLRATGVIDPRQEEIAKEGRVKLKTVINDYIASMVGGVEHAEKTQTQIEAIAKQESISNLADISADRLNRFTANLRSKKRSARTIASYIQSIKGLTRWAVRNGKLLSDPLATVRKPSVEDDRKLTRRFLTVDEWHWLDSSTRQGDFRFGMTGQERAILYALAIQTGLRSNECRSLTRGKLHLTQSPPFVIADAKSTKNKKTARQYLQPELAFELQSLVSKKLAGAKVFPLPHTCSVVDMLRYDLERARNAWLNTLDLGQTRIEADAGDFLRASNSEGEKIDFHALRHTTATWLIERGADIKTVQSVLRHSTIKLTMDSYGHLYPGSEAAAVSKLRVLFAPADRQRATGTEPVLKRPLQRPGCETVRTSANQCEIEPIRDVLSETDSTNEKSGETNVFAALSAMRALGLEPRTQGLKVPCSTN